MQSNDSRRSRAFWARGFIVLGAVLGLGLSAQPTAAAPFTYVVNKGDGTVLVIDTAANKLVGQPIQVGNNGPSGVAVTPDGKHVYVAHSDEDSGQYFVSVIDTATNAVTSVPVVATAIGPVAVVITPDGKFAYAANWRRGAVAMIDTSVTPQALAAAAGGIPVGGEAVFGLAVTPNGKRVSAETHAGVAVIGAATNAVAGQPITLGGESRE